MTTRSGRRARHRHPTARPVRVAALLRKVVRVRVDDLRFVRDALPAALPASAAGSLRATADWRRTGAFGQSAGGFAALQAAHDDARLLAAANLDGVIAYVQEDSDSGFLSTVAADGLDRPFLLVGKDGNTRRTVPSWNALWCNSRGPRAGFSLRGAEHGSFTDYEVTVPQLARRLGLSASTVAKNIGTVPPRRAVAANRALLAAFFGRWLRGRDGQDGHSPVDRQPPRYPDLRPFT